MSPAAASTQRVWDAGGSGRPVVLTHGAGADHHMFDPQVAALVEAGYRPITWDLRGHGAWQPAGSPLTADRFVDDLVELIADLGLVDPVLLGQSLGGNISQRFVHDHPGVAAGVAIIGSAWNTEPLSWLDRQLVRTAAPAMHLIPASRLALFMADASAVTADARAELTREFGQLTKTGFIDVWRATTKFLSPDPDYRTPVPLLLMRGSEDRTGNIAAAMPRWARAEGIDEHVIVGAGHVANLDDPAAVNAVLLRWLSSD